MIGRKINYPARALSGRQALWDERTSTFHTSTRWVRRPTSSERFKSCTSPDRS